MTISATDALLAIRILKALVGLVTDIAASGKDPVTEIERIRRSKEWMAGADEELEASVKRKFGG